MNTYIDEYKRIYSKLKNAKTFSSYSSIESVAFTFACKLMFEDDELANRYAENLFDLMDKKYEELTRGIFLTPLRFFIKLFKK